MNNAFRDMLEGLKQTAEGLVIANQGIVLANEGIQKSVDAALRANDEHEDIRETVHRLESLVLDLTRRLPPLEGGTR